MRLNHFYINLKNKFFGTLFEVGCFSLSITKIVNMVYGGFCTTNSKTIANKLRQLGIME